MDDKDLRWTLRRAMLKLRAYGGFTTQGIGEALRLGGCELSKSQVRALFSKPAPGQRDSGRGLSADEFSALMDGLEELERLPEKTLVANKWVSSRSDNDNKL